MSQTGFPDDLQRLANLWSDIPEAVRSSILFLAEAVKK